MPDARRITTGPYTDFKAIAQRCDNPVLTGEGDNRVLPRNNPEGFAPWSRRWPKRQR